MVMLVFTASRAQQPLDWKSLDEERNRIATQGLWTMGGWSMANLAYSALAMNISEGEAKYFHQMNVGWTAVNISIAVPGLIMLHREQSSNLAPEVMGRFRKAEMAYAFNTGLDVAYVAAGFWMRDRAGYQMDGERWRGFGNAMILQGGFLFAYDIWAMIRMARMHKRKILPVLNNVNLGAGPMGFSLKLHI